MCIYYSCRINPWHRLQYLEPNIQIILMSAVIFALNSHSSPQWHIYCFHLWHINTLHFIYFSFLFTREKKEADFNPWYQPLHFWQDPNPRSKSPSPDHHSRPPKKQLIHSDSTSWTSHLLHHTGNKKSVFLCTIKYPNLQPFQWTASKYRAAQCYFTFLFYISRYGNDGWIFHG